MQHGSRLCKLCEVLYLLLFSLIDVVSIACTVHGTHRIERTMDKENNKSAAGLRRSAIAERIRLREEWSALKGPEAQKAANQKKTATNILTKSQTNTKSATANYAANKIFATTTQVSTRHLMQTNDTLRGVVALVEVGTECRALPLRAALSALGASVLPAWSPLITHLVWSQGGCRATRARGRALACRLVSPLWVEACAAASRHLPEHAFPAAARASDLPSPKTLRRLLKKADMENIPIADLLSDGKSEQQLNKSSDTEHDTSNERTDTSRDDTNDTSHDTSNDTSLGIESRVNTATRRALPKVSESVSPIPQPTKSRRKLFTHKEAELTREEDESEDDTAMPPKPRKPSIARPKNKTKANEQPKKLTHRDRRELARAERTAKKLLAGSTPAVTQNTQQGLKPRIVLTGMCGSERRAAGGAVLSLGGRLQAAVSRRTTHVLLGGGGEHDADGAGLTGITNLSPSARGDVQKLRTLNALCGAARGCRVLRAQWALDCRRRNTWLHHTGYEVQHLKKISQKARVERCALGKQRSEYAYDVFSGMRVKLARTVTHRQAALRLLTLCGAVVINEGTDENCIQNGGMTQNGRRTQHAGLTQNHVTKHLPYQSHTAEYDIKIGDKNGEINSKWVFDSVAAGRMRTARRYVINSLSESELVTQMERIQC